MLSCSIEIVLLGSLLLWHNCQHIFSIELDFFLHTHQKYVFAFRFSLFHLLLVDGDFLEHLSTNKLSTGNHCTVIYKLIHGMGVPHRYYCYFLFPMTTAQ